MPDIDWGQVIFLILFVIVGFVRWLGNLIEQRKEAKERASLSPEEIARREAAWRKQVGQDLETAPAPTATPPPLDPFRQLKDLFDQLNEPAPKPQPQPQPQAQRPSTPPPLVQVQRPAPPPQRTQPPPIPVPAKPANTPVAAPVLAKAFPTSNFVHRSFTEAVAHRDRRTSAKLMSLRLDLRSPSALRRAIVIREILGPPKALAEE